MEPPALLGKSINLWEVDVNLSMYTPSVPGAFVLWNIVIYQQQQQQQQQKILCRNQMDTGRT